MSETIPANDPIEAAEAAYYDDHHIEWQRDEWRKLANRYEAALKEIATLTKFDENGKWRWISYKELFMQSQQIAEEAFGS